MDQTATTPENAAGGAPEGRRGREARRAARVQRSGVSIPYITRNLPAHRDPDGRGSGDHRAQCRNGSPGDRNRVPRPSSGARPPEGRRLRRARRARALPARTGASARRDRAVGIRPARPQLRAQRSHRRQVDGVRAGLRPALRPRPRQGPALRHDRGFPELREARLYEPLHAPFGGHGVRAGRRAGQQAAPRHGLRAHALFRQAVHGVGHRPRARPGHGRHGGDPVRTGLHPEQHRRHEPDQRELADGVGLDDARRCRGLRGQQPGHDHHARSSWRAR